MGYKDIPGKFTKHLVGGSLTRAGVWVGDKVGGLAGNGLIGQAARSTVTDVALETTEQARNYMNLKLDKIFVKDQEVPEGSYQSLRNHEFETDPNDPYSSHEDQVDDEVETDPNDPYSSRGDQEVEEEKPRGYKDIPRKIGKHLVGGSLARAGAWVGDKVGGLAGNGLMGQAARSTITDVALETTDQARNYMDDKMDNLLAGHRRSRRQPSRATESKEYESGRLAYEVSPTLPDDPTPVRNWQQTITDRPNPSNRRNSIPRR